MICAECYRKTPAGKEEMREEVRMRKYEPLEGGGPCAGCGHWSHRCCLGLPEGGTRFAVDCPAMVTEAG